MKKLLGVLLIVFVFSGTAFAFAYWDSLEANDNDVTVGIGEGVTLSVNLDQQTDGVLVPSGVVMKTDDVTEVEIEYTVSLDRTDLVSALDLAVVVDNIKINNDTTHAGLVSVTPDNPKSIFNDSEIVTLTITLDMPGDESAYDAVNNQNITFDVTFNATQPE